ncbi:hypothetical protein HNP92_000889 [Methanococcus maripaludis]|uniref:Uncharacterized protein n=1 Tax=Methanococcus maripaludis TaxID=39152 RepID=A0A7J9PTM1_METMI|nr:hypothetical protein [Methanococcus maripaludis]MBA2868927.1 hypothetical protein [Methanococcus maripaludis]MBB6401584.1 hypothetical protein [Methanococcus maripaludis]
MSLTYILLSIIRIAVFVKIACILLNVLSWHTDKRSNLIVSSIVVGMMFLSGIVYFVFQGVLYITLSNLEWFVNMSFGNQFAIMKIPALFLTYVFAVFTKNKVIDYSLKREWITKLDSKRRLTRSYAKKEE